jgi:hypothetical protein
MNLVYWYAPQGDTGTQVVKFRIKKCQDRTGTYIQVAEISPAQTGGVFTLQYYDATGVKSDWYIIESVDTNTNVIAQSDPRRGETTDASAIDLIWKIRRKINDHVLPYCFPDWEMLDFLNEAKILHNRFKEWNEMSEQDELLIMWLAIANIALTLAQDSSKYFLLSIDGMTVDKSNRVEKYMSVHDKYMERYTTKRDEWQLNAERSGFIKESYMTRESFTTGRRTPYIFATPPEPIKLLPALNLSAGSAELRWTQSYDPGFYYYIVYRSTAPNVQKRVIEDVYNKRIALYDDPGDFASGLWGGVTVPIRMLYRNSVTYWTDQNRLTPDPFYSQWSTNLLLRENGTYYWVVGVVNKNMLISLSNEISATLPPLGPPTLLAPIRNDEGVIIATGVPTAFLTVELKRTTDPGYNVISTVALQTGTVPAARFVYGVGWLGVGSLVRMKQNFNGVDSAYSTPYSVV